MDLKATTNAKRSIASASVAASCCCFIVLNVTSTKARAQEFSLKDTSITITPVLHRSDVAGSRIEPGFDPLPIPFGAFDLSASVSTVAGADTNVLRRPGGKSDATMTMQPQVTIRRKGGSLDAQIEGAGRLRRYVRYTSENSGEYAGSASLSGRFAGRNRVTASAGYARMVEPRSSVGTIADAASPVSYRQFQASVGGTADLGRVTMQSSLRYIRNRYDGVPLRSGGRADLHFRDQSSIGGTITVDYDVNGRLATYASASHARISAANTALAISRDARDFTVQGGIRGEVTPLVYVDIAAGVRQRNYRDPRLRDYRGPTFKADLQWYVTPLVTFRLEGSQNLYNSGAPQANAINAHEVKLEAYYDLLRNLRIAANARREWDKFEGLDTRAKRFQTSVRAQYRASPHLSIGAFVAYDRQTVHGTAVIQPFSSFSVGIGATASL